MLFPLPGVALCSRVRLGLIVGAWFIILGRGNGSLLEVSMINVSFKGGGGALCLAVVGGAVWLCVLE